MIKILFIFIFINFITLSSFCSQTDKKDNMDNFFDYTLKIQDSSGLSCNLNSIKNKTAVLFYFSTTCGTCKIRLAKLLDLRDTISFTLIGIISGSNSKEDILDFMAKRDTLNSFSIYIDKYKLFKQEFNAQFVPTIVIVNKKGSILYQKVRLNKNDLESIKAILQKEMHIID